MDCKGLGLYMVGQSFAKQPVLRMSYGRRWIGQGVKERFVHLCDVYGFKRAVEIWSKTCRAGSTQTGKTVFQKRFRWKKLEQPTAGVVGCQNWKCTPAGFSYRQSSFQSFLDDPVYITPKKSLAPEENNFTPIDPYAEARQLTPEEEAIFLSYTTRARKK
jgi:hypothetical protein